MTKDAVSRVRDAFVAAGWTVDGVLDLLGAAGWAALGRDERVPAAHALRQDADAAATPAGLLTRLFLLREPVPQAEVAAALPWTPMHGLGLVDLHGDQAVAALDVRPYGETDVDWYVVSDLDDRRLRPDHVLGVGGASLTLAGLVPRLPRRTAVDLGTGCGVQALHLSRHVEHVVATDTNARALALADLGWRLSGLDPARVSWREGSLLGPVAGERVDLLVSNPPFVVSPAHRFTYRDAGLRGDELGRMLVERAPEHLADDGWCVLLANWLHQRGRDWRERVAAWAEPALAQGCDVWVAEREALDVARYASTWLTDAGDHLAPDYAARFDGWLGSFDEDGVEAVGMGWVVLHRSGRESPTLRVDDVSAAPRRPDGDEVVARLAAAARADDLDAVALLATPLRLSPGAILDYAELVGEPGTSPVELPSRVRLAADAGGWAEPVVLDATALALVRGCDGTRPVSRVVAEVAAATGADEDDVAVLALHVLRRLVDGALAVPSPAPASG